MKASGKSFSKALCITKVVHCALCQRNKNQNKIKALLEMRGDCMSESMIRFINGIFTWSSKDVSPDFTSLPPLPWGIGCIPGPFTKACIRNTCSDPHYTIYQLRLMHQAGIRWNFFFFFFETLALVTFIGGIFGLWCLDLGFHASQFDVVLNYEWSLCYY